MSWVLSAGTDRTVEQKGSEGWTTGVPRAAGLRPSLILCLPDELFQKVAEDYVSVAAFQVMTEDKGVDLSQKANPYFYSCCHH